MSQRDTNKFQFISASVLLTKHIVIDYLIDEVIEKDTAGQLFGPSGTGKTFVALDMALCIATGTPWNGHPVNQGLVVYFCAEGRAGISRRIKAWCKEHIVNETDISLLHISQQTIELSKANAENLHQAITCINKPVDMQISLIIIDTLARHMPCGDDENTTKDMSQLIHVMDNLREVAGNCVTMFVHHSGHGEQKRSRGSSALRAALDFEIYCDKNRLEFTKMKDSEPPLPIGFNLKTIYIGEEEFNIKSAVVTYGACLAKNSSSTAYTDRELQSIKSLIEASKLSQHIIYDKRAGSDKIWRELFYKAERATAPNTPTNTLKQAFTRAKESLINKGVLMVQDNYGLLISEKYQEEIAACIRSVHGTSSVQ